MTIAIEIKIMKNKYDRTLKCLGKRSVGERGELVV